MPPSFHHPLLFPSFHSLLVFPSSYHLLMSLFISSTSPMLQHQYKSFIFSFTFFKINYLLIVNYLLLKLFFSFLFQPITMAGLWTQMKTWSILHFLFCYILLVSGFITCFLMSLTLVLWPLNKDLYRKVNSYLAYLWWCRK